MSTTDGGNIWQIELLNDYLPDLAFNSIDVLENKKAWVTGLSDLLLVKQIFITNTEEIQSQNIQIYPNPVNTELNIRYERKVNNLMLFDIFGNAVIANQKISQKCIHLDMAQLPPGIYFLKINQEVKKIVKN